MKTHKRFVPFALAAWLTLLTVNSLVPSLFADTASAATNAINCITVGAGLKPAGQHCADFTLKVNFTPSGGSNGTSAAVARGDHNHDSSYWKVGGNSGTNPTTNFLGTTDGQPLILQPNTAKIGIGTRNPEYKLQVAAPDQLGLKIQGPKSGVGAGLQLEMTGAGKRGWELLAAGAASAQGADKFNIRDLGDESDDLTINAAGKVGIGNINPQYKLDVTAPDQLGMSAKGPRAGVGAGLRLETTGPGGRGWEVLATGATSAQGSDKLNIRDLGDGSDDLTITAVGNVGIGTTNPQSTLQVGRGYIQFPVRTDVPPATDCDSAAEQGRAIVGNPDFVDQRIVLYVCTRAGWAGVSGIWPTH